VRELREAGLGTVYLSLNGGLDDDLYEEIDGARCAARKLGALDNLLAARMQVNHRHDPDSGAQRRASWRIPRLPACTRRPRHAFPLGRPMGRHMDAPPFDLDGLDRCLRRALGPRERELRLIAAEGSSRDYRLGPVSIQLTNGPNWAACTAAGSLRMDFVGSSVASIWKSFSMIEAPSARRIHPERSGRGAAAQFGAIR